MFIALENVNVKSSTPFIFKTVEDISCF